MRIIYGQDGGDAIYCPLSLNQGDVRYLKREKRTIYDFVGFVINDEDILAVFPKHYFTDKELDDLNRNDTVADEDVRLLFRAFSKYIENTASKAKADRYLGSLHEYQSDYPFQAFYDVYDYYKKYGIFFEEESVVTEGQKGRILWKHTMQQSNIVISGGNIVYTPLYSKRIDSKSDFISECMIFVINHTIKNFPYFLSMKPIAGKYNEIDFIRNSEYVLRTLYQTRNKVFKDIHRKLIWSLIRFFEEINNMKHGGAIHLKINYFNFIWQEMVNQYLNDCFAGISASEDGVIFDETLSKSAVDFGVVTYEIDDSSNHFQIELDHYGISNDVQYIFDSKYYYEINELNYKQFTYDMVVDSFANRMKRIKTYSALLLPGNEASGFHLNLNSDFGGLTGKQHQVIEQYLNVKNVIKHYVNT